MPRNDVVLEDEVLKKLNMEDIRRIFDEGEDSYYLILILEATRFKN